VRQRGGVDGDGLLWISGQVAGEHHPLHVVSLAYHPQHPSI
jgi:hypothetical protein